MGGQPVPGLVDLDTAEAADPAVAGAKAASLARARRQGLPVLPGVVIPAAAPAGDLPRLAGAAWAAVAGEGRGPVVVRSSSAIEDQDRSSMAGVFTSVVGVGSPAALAEAAAAVRASAAVVAIGAGRARGPGPAPMAVLVQPQLPAGPGGVAFGTDPVSGRRGRVRVSASPDGPGAVVAGAAADDAVLGRRGRIVAGRLLLSGSQRRALVRLLHRAGRLFGAPQDVEFGFGPDGHLWLLQSRPVTTLAPHARRSAPVLGPGPLAETFPEPLRPLEVELWIDPLRQGVAGALEAVGVARRRIRRSPVVVVVGGRPALDLALGAPEAARGWRRLTPGRALRRLGTAWTLGRLRAALPGLAADLVARADAELTELPALVELDDGALLAVLHGARDRLRSLHGHEVLLGWLAAPHPGGGAPAASGAGVALEALARGRAEGLDDAELVARRPVVLALLPPRLGPPAHLPDAVGPDAGRPGPGQPGPGQPGPGQPGEPAPGPGPEASGAGGPTDTSAVAREALRLRIRWFQELTARAATELGTRLEAAGTLGDGALLGWLSLPELAAATGGGGLPPGLAARPRPPAPPLPPRFRLGPSGSVVPVLDPLPADGPRGVSGGRGRGVVADLSAGPPPTGSVVVVGSLDPRLAPVLGRLAGVVSETGSPLSHLAILARELAVPVVVGVEGATAHLAPGTTVVVDGASGEVVVDDRAPGRASLGGVA